MENSKQFNNFEPVSIGAKPEIDQDINASIKREDSNRVRDAYASVDRARNSAGGIISKTRTPSAMGGNLIMHDAISPHRATNNYKGIKIDTVPNQANGGVGVSYSNVVLGGGLDPRSVAKTLPLSSYQENYLKEQQDAQLKNMNNSPDQVAHNRRFVDSIGRSSSSLENPTSLHKKSAYAYVKGVDFNSKQKYDYNILSGQPLKAANSAHSKNQLQQAAS